MPPFPYRVTTGDAVAAVVATVRSDPAFVASCLVISSAHGFSMEIEYVQRHDGSMRYRVWSDVQGVISEEEREPAFDLVAELAAVRRAPGLDRRLPDATGRARYAVVVLADREGGMWVEAPTPERGDATIDGPLGRILTAVFS